MTYLSAVAGTLATPAAFTSSATWNTIDATTSTADSENTANISALNDNSARQSAQFTPGGSTAVTGVLVKVASLTGPVSGDGTVTCSIIKVSDASVVATCVVNVTDLPVCGTTNKEGGWFCFKMSGTMTAAAHVLQLKCSTTPTHQPSFYTTGTAYDWIRFIRTSTPQAPGSGDITIACAEFTNTGAFTARYVKIDNTSTVTVFGGLVAGYGGIVTFDAATTNAYYKTNGNVILYGSGTLSLGASGAAITTTAKLELVPGSDGGIGLSCRSGTFNTLGTAKMSSTTLAADAASTSTSFTVNASGYPVSAGTGTAGWNVGDSVVFASTTRTASETEKLTLNTVPSGTTFTTTGGSAATHSGTAPHAAEVINITRNVVIFASGSFYSYIYFGPACAVSMVNAEVSQMGATTAGQRGIEMAATSGSAVISGCSLHDCKNFGLYVVAATGTANSIHDNCFYNLVTAATAGQSGVTISANSGSVAFNNNVILGVALSSTGYGIDQQDAGSSLSNNVVAGCSGNVAGSAWNFSESGGALGTHSGNTTHSNACTGLRFTSNTTGTISSFTTYYNTGVGVTFINGNDRIIFSNGLFFGNTTSNMSITAPVTDLWLQNCVFRGDPTFTTASGINVPNSGSVLGYMMNTTFGVTTAHTSTDITEAGAFLVQFYCWNCTFNSNIFLGAASEASFVRSHNNGNVAGAHSSVSKGGTITNNSVTVHTAGGYSWQMAPSSGTTKLLLIGPSQWDTFKAVVNANLLVSISVYIMCTSGPNYAGNLPRLVVRGGMVAGVGSIGSDLITVAGSLSLGNWQQLTVQCTPTEKGTLEFYVDCDGANSNTGAVLVDDFSILQ